VFSLISISWSAEQVIVLSELEELVSPQETWIFFKTSPSQTIEVEQTSSPELVDKEWLALTK